MSKKIYLTSEDQNYSPYQTFLLCRTPQRLDVSISDGILQTGVLQLDSTMLKSASSWPMSVIGRSLFLAQESLKLCGLSCGGLCQVSVEDEVKGIFMAWPQTLLDSKIEAMMSLDAMAALGVQSLDVISIQKWCGQQQPLAELRLKVANDKDRTFLAYPAFKAVTALALKKVVVFENMALAVNYYGRLVKLLVDKVVPSAEPGEDLLEVTNQLQKVHLDFSHLEDDLSSVSTSTPSRKVPKDERKLFYSVDESTRLFFETFSPEKATESASSEEKLAAEVLGQIGGLDAEVELIQEAARSVLGQKPSRLDFLIIFWTVNTQSSIFGQWWW